MHDCDLVETEMSKAYFKRLIKHCLIKNAIASGLKEQQKMTY